MITPRPPSSPPPFRQSKRAKTPRRVRSVPEEEEQGGGSAGIDECFELEGLEEEKLGGDRVDEDVVNQAGQVGSEEEGKDIDDWEDEGDLDVIQDEKCKQNELPEALLKGGEELQEEYWDVG